jgi:hypothetical protein
MSAARILATCLLCLLPLALGGARPAAPPNPGPGLAGTTWHTVRIDGEAMFFVVREVGIRFEDGARFAAAVRFIDGQQQSRTGTYRVPSPGTLVLAIEGLGKPKELKFQRQGADLIVRDHAYDVTVRLAPGKMEEERWF